MIGLSLTILIALSSPDDMRLDNGWWCETREGHCHRYERTCNDESCHWRQEAWVTYWEPFSSMATTTEASCERYRNWQKQKTSKCKIVR